ncbi:hypothetical protein ACFRJ8_20955 [Arthrobacter sp. NPDC056886]|uniref:hypothetical protein n=1 Tax=Arthrobacter sp. NPDC056886 TaxID=3345960 RepID=UPI00366D9174
MNLDTIVHVGSRPWLPSPSASNLDAWHEDDVPVAGIFDLGGEKILFTAVGGVDSDLTVWAYLPLSAAEYFELDELIFESVPELICEIERRFEGRCFALASARSFVIDYWTALLEPADSVYSASTNFLKDLVAALKAEVRASKNDPGFVQDDQMTRLMRVEYFRSPQAIGRRDEVRDFLVNRSVIGLVLS